MIKKDEITVLWDSQIHTDKKIQANKPDIVVKDEKKRECTLVDILVPSDTNIVLKTSEKICKYRDLQIEISRCWTMNTKVVPIVVGTLGTVGKDLSLKLSTLPESPKIYEIQKTGAYGHGANFKSFGP